jgi:hypothetical protein
LKRGSWVKHPKHGLCYLGGQTGKVISLHSQQTGERLTKVNPRSLSFVCRSSWRLRTGEGEGNPALRAASYPTPR